MSSFLQYMSFLYLWILLLFSCSLWGIEINSDSFVSAESQEEEEETSLELSAPNMERAYKKEKVIIKRDLSALDSAVDSAEYDSSLNSLKDQEEGSEAGAKRKPASVPLQRSYDYGDKEIRWQGGP